MGNVLFPIRGRGEGNLWQTMAEERLVGGSGGVNDDAGVGEAKVMHPGSVGMGFSLMVTFGVFVLSVAIGGSTWDKKCDQPLQLYLVLMGLCAMLAFLVYFGLSSARRESGGVSQLIVVAFVIFVAVFGSSLQANSEDCSAKSKTADKTTFATLLALYIMIGLIISGLLGSLGGPVFGAMGHLMSSLFAWLASLFNDLHSALTEPTDPEDQPPKRTLSGDFALHINHAIFMWFFAYIFLEALSSWNDKCDRHLHRYLM